MTFVRDPAPRTGLWWRDDAVHRVLGRVWATTMLVVAGGSFFFGHWDRPIDWFLRALATWTLFTVSWGWRSARAGDAHRHARGMVGTYVGLLAAFGFVFYPGRLLPTWLGARPLLMTSLGAVVVVVAVGVVWLVMLLQGGRHRATP